MIEIVNSEIDELSVLRAVRSDNCGASVLFCGTTRCITGERQTARLDYECYPELAIKKIAALADEARSKWPVEKIAIVHRVGTVPVGETSIAIAVASPHRPEAFAAGQWLIDTLKTQVPIWKKEVWADGTTEWMHPISGVVRPEEPSEAGNANSHPNSV